jgi:hypothetical protein
MNEVRGVNLRKRWFYEEASFRKGLKKTGQSVYAIDTRAVYAGDSFELFFSYESSLFVQKTIFDGRHKKAFSISVTGVILRRGRAVFAGQERNSTASAVSERRIAYKIMSLPFPGKAGIRLFERACRKTFRADSTGVVLSGPHISPEANPFLTRARSFTPAKTGRESLFILRNCFFRAALRELFSSKFFSSRRYGRLRLRQKPFPTATQWARFGLSGAFTPFFKS